MLALIYAKPSIGMLSSTPLPKLEIKPYLYTDKFFCAFACAWWHNSSRATQINRNYLKRHYPALVTPKDEDNEVVIDKSHLRLVSPAPFKNGTCLCSNCFLAAKIDIAAVLPCRYCFTICYTTTKRSFRCL